MNSTPRPISVSVISWILIITSGFSVVFLPFSLNNPTSQQVFRVTGAPPAAVLALSLLGGIANIAAGVAMLKRLRWGRQLYLVVTPFVLLLSIAIYGLSLLAIF